MMADSKGNATVSQSISNSRCSGFDDSE